MAPQDLDQKRAMELINPFLKCALNYLTPLAFKLEFAH